MRKSSRWPVALPAVVLLAAAATATANGSDVVKGSFERTLKVTGPVDLEVTTGSGDIKVRTGEAGTVEIKARIQGHYDRDQEGGNVEESVHYLEQHPPIEQDGNHIRIGRMEDRHLSRNISIDYELTVPAETQFNGQTGSGDLSVEGIRGPVDAKTGSGNMDFRSISSNVRVRTGSGDAKFEGISADRVEIETGSGNTDLRDMRCSLSLRTGSGDIRAQGEPTGEWNLRSGSGEITIHLPSELAFDLDAHTSSGGVSTGLPITLQGTLGRGELRGKVRGGGVRLELHTGSGDIRVE